MKRTVKEIIRQRRSQMLVHSYLYYRLDKPIISDDTWQKWANELAELQRENPFDCKIVKAIRLWGIYFRTNGL